MINLISWTMTLAIVCFEYVKTLKKLVYLEVELQSITTCKLSIGYHEKKLIK
jgi:hypothetical protein